MRKDKRNQVVLTSGQSIISTSPSPLQKKRKKKKKQVGDRSWSKISEAAIKSHEIKGKVLNFILWCSTAFCPFDGIKFKKRERESWWQTPRSELKWKGHVPQWWRSVLPWSPAWPVPQPAPLVAGAINEDQKQNTIICFLVNQE